MRDDQGDTGAGDAPLHGFQGDRGPAPPREAVPRALTVALSREAGARGSTIARRAGRKLGWQVYDQELLEFMSQDATVGYTLVEQLPPAAGAWVEAHLERLLREQSV